MVVVFPHRTFAASGPAPIDLRSSARFAILAGSAITGGGGTISGDVGLSPTTGAAITGLSTGQVNGFIDAVDAAGPAGAMVDPARLTTAKADLTAAYNDAAGRSVDRVTLADGANIGGQTLAPGLYEVATSLQITGDLTLDAGGDPNAVWIFQVGSTLTTAAGGVGDPHSRVILAGGAQAGNVFWQVGSSATLGTYSVFKGTILARTSITMDIGCAMEGRALAQDAAVIYAGQSLKLPATDVDADTDHDGMPDWWETQYGLNPNSATDAVTDADGDGVDNLDEYVSGTDPNDAASCLRVMDVRRSGSNDVAVTVYIGSNRTNSILGASASTGPWTSLVAFTNGESGMQVWTDRHVIATATQRFYRVTATCGTLSYTNTAAPDYAVIVPTTLLACTWSLMGVPVNLTLPDNNLHGELGRQLAVGLTAARDLSNCFDRVYVPNPDGSWKDCLLAILPDGSTNWWDVAGDTVANVTINPAAAFWVKRCSPTAPAVMTAWTGRSFTNAPTIGLASGWTLFSWPLGSPGYHHNLGAATPVDQLGFLAAGATGGKSGTYGMANGDELWAWNGTRWSQYWLVGIGNTNFDGRWWDATRNQFGEFALETGKGYFYLHRGTNVMFWTPHEAATQ